MQASYLSRTEINKIQINFHIKKKYRLFIVVDKIIFLLMFIIKKFHELSFSIFSRKYHLDSQIAI